jgi:hypothetical protein
MSQWIKTSDRLPAFGQRVLVYTPGRTIEADVLRNGKVREGEPIELPAAVDIEVYAGTTVKGKLVFMWGSDFEGYREELDYPTHWMPLPAFPDGEESHEGSERTREGATPAKSHGTAAACLPQTDAGKDLGADSPDDGRRCCQGKGGTGRCS